MQQNRTSKNTFQFSQWMVESNTHRDCGKIGLTGALKLWKKAAVVHAAKRRGASEAVCCKLYFNCSLCNWTSFRDLPGRNPGYQSIPSWEETVYLPFWTAFSCLYVNVSFKHVFTMSPPLLLTPLFV